MSEAMTGRQRMRMAFALKEPDCVPVSPDISAMVPVRLSGKPFDRMFLDGLPHHGYASASVAQAYVDAVKYYGMDGWYIYGALPEVVLQDRPRWQARFVPRPEGGQIGYQVAQTPYGELTRTTIYPPTEPPWEVEKPIKDLKRDWPRLRALMGEDGDWQWETAFADRERIGESGVYAVAIGIPQEGNVNTFDFMLHATPAQVEEKAKRLIDECAAGGGFVLSTGDQCGRDTPDANIFKLVEVARTYGQYR